MLDIHIVKNSEEKKNVFKIRQEVFVVGQDIDPKIEYDEFEDDSIHIIAYQGDDVVGCARIREYKGKLKLERIAVLEKFRGRGFGKDITKFMVDYGNKQGKEMIMHAQHYLLKFYSNLGFKPVGETFMEAEIEHIKMVSN